MDLDAKDKNWLNKHREELKGEPDYCAISGAGHDWGTLQYYERGVARGQCDCGAVRFFSNAISAVFIQRAMSLNIKHGRVGHQIPKAAAIKLAVKIEGKVEEKEAEMPVPERPKKYKEQSEYWEQNKEAVLADYGSMKLHDFYDQWHLDGHKWLELKNLWGVKGHRPGRKPAAASTTEPSPEPTEPPPATPAPPPPPETDIRTESTKFEFSIPLNRGLIKRIADKLRKPKEEPPADTMCYTLVTVTFMLSGTLDGKGIDEFQSRLMLSKSENSPGVVMGKVRGYKHGNVSLD